MATDGDKREEGPQSLADYIKSFCDAFDSNSIGEIDPHDFGSKLSGSDERYGLYCNSRELLFKGLDFKESQRWGEALDCFSEALNVYPFLLKALKERDNLIQRQIKEGGEGRGQSQGACSIPVGKYSFFLDLLCLAAEADTLEMEPDCPGGFVYEIVEQLIEVEEYSRAITLLAHIPPGDYEVEEQVKRYRWEAMDGWGLQCLAAGNYDGAIKYLVHSDDALRAAYFERGRIHFEAERYVEAFSDIWKAYEIESSTGEEQLRIFKEAGVESARLHFEEERYHEASEVFVSINWFLEEFADEAKEFGIELSTQDRELERRAERPRPGTE